MIASAPLRPNSIAQSQAIFILSFVNSSTIINLLSIHSLIFDSIVLTISLLEILLAIVPQTSGKVIADIIIRIFLFLKTL